MCFGARSSGLVFDLPTGHFWPPRPDVCQGLAGSVPEAENAAAVAPGARPLGNQGPFRSRDASAAVAVAAEADRTPALLGRMGRERPAWVALQAFRLAVRIFRDRPAEVAPRRRTGRRSRSCGRRGRSRLRGKPPVGTRARCCRPGRTGPPPPRLRSCAHL